MLGGAVELPMNLAVTHGLFLYLFCRDGSSDNSLRWAACVRPKWCGREVPRPRRLSVVVLEALGELVDILRRPARHFHAEMQTHLGQHFLDLVERLAAEIRGAEHFRFRLLHEVADIDDVV